MPWVKMVPMATMNAWGDNGVNDENGEDASTNGNVSCTGAAIAQNKHYTYLKNMKTILHTHT